MAITEKSRHELYRRLEEILGPDEATTLMEHLPPVGWADVATKEDLHQLETRLDATIDGLDARLGSRIDVLGYELRTEMHSTLRTNAYVTIGAIAALVGLLSALSTLS
jgi:hypothetical protein